MIQQAIATSTAIILSVSLLSPQLPSNENTENPVSQLTISDILRDVSLDNPASEDDGKSDDQTQSPRGESDKTPTVSESKHPSSGSSSGVPVGLKNQSDSTRRLLQNFGLPTCRITQSEDSHHTPEGGHSFALDMACVQGVSYDVRAPDFKDFYVVAYIGQDKRLGDYIVLRHGDERWVFGHTQTTRKVGQRIEPGNVIGQSNDSGHSKGIHTHAEYWRGKVNMTFDGKRTNEHSQKLCTQREWKFCEAKKIQVSTKSGGLQKYYFTHYDLGDINQNDSAPCHGASGADLCFLARQGVNTMALTVDIRQKLGVKFGDKVILEGDAGCRGIYEVHDEMNKRYRTSCQLRPGTNYCIKGDLPGRPGGACTVQKIKY